MRDARDDDCSRVRYSRIVKLACVLSLALASGLGGCSRTGAADLPLAHTAADATTPKLGEREGGAGAEPRSMFGQPSGVVAHPPEDPPTCEDVKDVFLFVTPGTAWTGAPLRVMAVSDRPLSGELRLVHQGSADTSRPVAPATSPPAPAVSSDIRRGGPPYFWVAELEAPKAGVYDAVLTQKACAAGEGSATKRITVGTFKPGPPAGPTKDTDGLWEELLQQTRRIRARGPAPQHFVRAAP